MCQIIQLIPKLSLEENFTRRCQAATELLKMPANDYNKLAEFMIKMGYFAATLEGKVSPANDNIIVSKPTSI